MIKEKMQRLRAKGLLFHNIDILKRYMVKEHELMIKEKSDRVGVISGYEGSGKSYLAMDLHEYWYTKVLKNSTKEDIKKTFCFTDVDWAKALVHSKEKPCFMITHDEAVNILYRKEASTKKNKEINKGFKKFRGKQWYHLMLIPQMHRMDKEMVEDRVRNLLFVFTYNGSRYVAVYTKKRLDSLIAEISRMIDSTAKDVKSRPQVLNCATDPAMICKIPMYEGKMLMEYAQSKEHNMNDSVDAIEEVLSGKIAKQLDKVEKAVSKKKVLSEYKKGNKTQEELAVKHGVTARTIRNWLKDEAST
jgi:hypothetical protein